MRRSYSTDCARFLAVLTLLLNSGCASFNGRPDPVIPVRTSLEAARNYNYATALAEWDAATDSLTRQKVRDKFITLQIDAADALYVDFLNNLSKQTRGSNFGLDLISLGLAGGGAVAGKGTANALSAAAGGITGTRAAFSKDVFFEKTMPAVVAEMASARTQALANLRAGLRKSPEDYKLADALIDVNIYKNSTSLDDGIKQIVKNAVDDSDKVTESFQAEFGVCLPDKTSFVPRFKVKSYLDTLVISDPNNDLDSMLTTFKIDTAGIKDSSDKKARIIDYVAQKLCTSDSIKTAFGQWDKQIFQ